MVILKGIMQENKWPSVSLLNWAQAMALANAFDRSNAIIFIYTHLEILSRSSQVSLFTLTNRSHQTIHISRCWSAAAPVRIRGDWMGISCYAFDVTDSNVFFFQCLSISASPSIRYKPRNQTGHLSLPSFFLPL